MAAFNKQQQDLLRRLSKVSGRQLHQLSKVTSLISYQRGYTKHGLANVIKGTKNKAVLNALSDVISTYERYGIKGGAGGILSDIIATTTEGKIKQFISIQQSKGWTDEEILIAIDNSYDTILYISSGDMQRVESVDELAGWGEE